MGEKTIDHSARAHALLSASSAHRWLACPPSAVAAEKYPSQDTEWTREGTLAHEVAEMIARDRFVDMPVIPLPEDADADMIAHARSYADYIQELIKTDDATVLLEQRVDYAPWAPEGFGTCDCILMQGDTLTIIDYKYGVGVAVSAVNNPQMKLYALGALNMYGVAYDIKRVETHIFQPRIDNISSDQMTVEELFEWGESIKPTAKKAAKGKGEYSPGEHCKFCPHAGKCRQLTKVCTEYVETHDLRVAVPVLAPHEIAEVLKMRPLIDLWLKRIESQALDTLLGGGEVPGYKLVEGRLGFRKWTDEIAVSKALQAAGYSFEDITKTELRSPAEMDKAIGKKKAEELVGTLIERAPGKPTIVPKSDKRPAYDRRADVVKDFE
jgi:hypothetical protein